MFFLPVVVPLPEFRGIIGELAPVAQWTEYLTSNQSVGRSSRPGGAKYSGKQAANPHI
jgi:hypothetical protein